jgi:hypothetical protein
VLAPPRSQRPPLDRQASAAGDESKTWNASERASPSDGKHAATERAREHFGYHDVPQPMLVEPAERPLNLLFVYNRPPLPMIRGDQQHAAHLLEFFFTRGHVVDLLTLRAPSAGLLAEQRAWLESRCRTADRFLGIGSAA